MPIQAVTFDLWETLVAHTPENDVAIRQLRYERMQTALGREIHREQFQTAYRRSWEKFEEIWITNREVQTEEQLDIFLTLLFNSSRPALNAETRKKLEDAYLSPVRDHPPVVYPDVLPVLTELQKRKLPLGMICNTGRTPGRLLRPILQAQGILDFFRVALFSNELDLRKPAPEIFHVAIRELGAVPETTVHVGDRPNLDIQGALGAGLQAVQIDRYELYQPTGKWPFIRSLPELIPLLD